MTYDEARPLIADGDLIAWRGTGPVSRLIRRVTMGGVTHVGVAWHWREADRLFVLEQREFRGVTLRALSNCRPFLHISTGVAAELWHPGAWTAAVAELGKPYSYLDAARAGLNIPMLGDGGICSAYARAVLRDSGLAIPDSVQHPQALVEWVQGEIPSSITRVVR